MGFMDMFARKRKTEKKANNSLPTSLSIFAGGSKAGVHVDEVTAMQVSAIYACVRVIAESFATLPMHVHRHVDNGSEIIRDHHLYYLLHYAPNPDMTSFVFRETMMYNLVIHGNAYAQIIRDRGGRVIELHPLQPYKMRKYRDDNGKIYYEYSRHYDEFRNRQNASDSTGTIRLRSDEVMHIVGLSNNGLEGLLPIGLAKNAIGLAIAIEEYGAGFFRNGATPSGVLEHPDSIREPEDVSAAWQAMYGGVENSNKIAVLEDGLQFKPISIQNDNAQFLETRKYQTTEIARAMRVPPHMIGDLEKSSYNNIEQQALEFVKYTVQPWVERWEQQMQMSLILPSEKTTHYIKFNMNAMMRGAYEDRMKGYQIGINSGFLCPNDARAFEELNLIDSPAGNRFMVNGNMIGIEDVGKQWEGVKNNCEEILELLKHRNRTNPPS